MMLDPETRAARMLIFIGHCWQISMKGLVPMTLHTAQSARLREMLLHWSWRYFSSWLHHESLGRGSVVQQQQILRMAFILFLVLQNICLLSQEHLPRDPSLAPAHIPPRGLEGSADSPLPGIQKLHFQPLFLVFSITTSQFSVSLFFSCLFLPSPAHESPPCSTLEHSLSFPWAWRNSCEPQTSLHITPIAIIRALAFDAFANSFSQITLGNPSATFVEGSSTPSTLSWHSWCDWISPSETSLPLLASKACVYSLFPVQCALGSLPTFRGPPGISCDLLF